PSAPSPAPQHRLSSAGEGGSKVYRWPLQQQNDKKRNFFAKLFFFYISQALRLHFDDGNLRPPIAIT
ncbi:hypothetical protein, partial [Ruegeria lacuscaerulensis]|uniref:hypothetical protein n=1 Tax=Ruegeria lacuscaerulensis TaxID=55218 RepID=UPI001BE40090